MKIFIAGAHGTTGQKLVKILSEKGHQVKAMIRDSSQEDEMKQLGAEPVIADLEKDKDFPLNGIEVVYFCAGSGAATGPDKTTAVDEKGAIKLVESAYKHKVFKFIMLSSLGADDPKKGPENLQHYLKAKHEADKELKFSGLAYTILRPGRLTNEPGTGKITAKELLDSSERGRSISREDVARTLAACIDHRHTENKVFELVSGETPIDKALMDLPLVQR
ncbi:SDR family oxidoreductase [Nafulsella turpanensis]|uniref:SDR family oxidoreductase n=1 Tax=Nafulsella turpanensis TaxID=1265690 RepID=UPI00034A5840|nr:SDR family oxidoreductase [Nafulsella turpanensis]